MNTVPVIILFDKDYADEFSVYGIRVTTLEKWAAIKMIAKDLYDSNPKKFANEEYYFGTNEAIMFDSYDDFVRSCKVIKITEAEVVFLRSIFNAQHDQDTFGFGCFKYPGMYE